jgi:predicted nuclease of restriction endonuclease-like (RecB) superfamily
MKRFSPQNLKYMKRFAQEYNLDEIGQQAVDQLPWGHNIVLMYEVACKKERAFYIAKVIELGWSRSKLIHQIELKLFHREGKAVTNFTSNLPSHQSDLALQSLKDPYTFDFLNLGDAAHEREIENSLIKHMKKFLLELGAGFAFVGQQYHLEVGDEDFYLDLLFYHLKLRSFVVIELKADKFKPEHTGKMNFYLSVLDDQLKHETDNFSIGLILCKTKNQVTAEYALRDVNKAIGLAEYKLAEALPSSLTTELPTIEELETELSKEYNLAS